MNNPFYYDSASDPNYATIGTSSYPMPTQNQYKCSFTGSGQIQPFTIEGTELCAYCPDVSWSGGVSCSWKKTKWGIPVLKCTWTPLVVTYKSDWCECWTTPDISLVPATTINMTIDTNININQYDTSYVLTSTPPSSTVTLTNGDITICDYTNTQDFTNDGVTYTNVPCMTLKVTVNGDSDDPLYIPIKKFAVVTSSYFPTTINIISNAANSRESNGYTYKTNTSLNMYIDTNNTSSWIYFVANISLDIYDSFGTKWDSTSTTFNLNLQSISEIV